MERIAKAVWRGGPRAGEGTVSTASGVFDNVIYTQGTSAIDVPCTNPVEMLAAAEAACVSLMISKELDRRGIEAEFISTEARIDLALSDEGWYIPRVHLTVHASIGEVDEARFHEAVQAAKSTCPISRSLKADITLEAIVEPVMMAAAAH